MDSWMIFMKEEENGTICDMEISSLARLLRNTTEDFGLKISMKMVIESEQH